MSTLLNNRYRILKTLGSGGCGRTFLAEDTHMPSNRRCVIKQLKPSTSDLASYQIIKERFQREAAILEVLGQASDQIPTLHAYFAEDREFYLVQDWVEGRNLVQRVNDEGAFSETKVRSFLLQLLPILDHVHSQGIVHRDIKPENIMLRDRDDKPILIDFGAVKEVVADTSTTIIIGSPGFIAPEQANGKPVFASDLYSLGLTAAYLLSGKRPLELMTQAEGDWTRQLSVLAPTLTPIISRVTRLPAHERYQSALEMLAAINSPDTPTIPFADTGEDTIYKTPTPAVDSKPSSHSRADATPSRGGSGLRYAAVLVIATLLLGALALLFYERKKVSLGVASAPPTVSPDSAQYEVTLTNDLFTSVRAAPRTTAPEIKRVYPESKLTCQTTTVKGEKLWENNEWRYCPSVGGYIHSTLLKPAQ